MAVSRDLALIVMFSVVGFVFTILIGQIPQLITGIPGIGYVFTIVHSIIITVAVLMFKGRRWRILGQGILFTMLCSTLGRDASGIFVLIATILNVFILDVVFNSLYKSFRKGNKLVWWAILTQIYYWPAHSILILLISSLYIPINSLLETWFIPIMSIMLPIIIIEAIAGGFIGYKIYTRVEKTE